LEFINNMNRFCFNIKYSRNNKLKSVLFLFLKLCLAFCKDTIIETEILLINGPLKTRKHVFGGKCFMRFLKNLCRYHFYSKKHHAGKVSYIKFFFSDWRQLENGKSIFSISGILYCVQWVKQMLTMIII
jgi:hypothetical protein